MQTAIPKTSGIYQILCSPSGKVYIGSAVNLRRRWTDHRKYLRGMRHGNPYLQRAWNKHGETSFVFSILELADPPTLIEAEQRWIDTKQCCDPEIGYNIAPTAGSNLGRTFSKEYCQAISARNSIAWPGFITPDGEEITIRSLWAFCKEHDLSFGAMWRLANNKGTTRSYKGWRHVNSPVKGRSLKVYEGFVDPRGQPVEPITDMVTFCRDNNLNVRHMNELYNHPDGRLKSHKGWTCKRGAI